MSNRAGPSGYMSRMRNRNLRSTVITFAIGGFVWTLTFSISAFQEISTDNSQRQKKLASLSIVLGSLYIGAAAIFLFGVFAAASVRRLLTALNHSQIPHATMQRRLALIRIFSFLSAAAAVIIIASGFLRTIVHFMLKSSLISECTALATGQNVVTVWGVWNSGPDQRLTPTEANQFCRNAWNHDSFSEILWLIIEISASSFT
ncbi:hypothetical protein F5888DRAFT_1698412 [Russula emetica]|nr:hypothetical protein F5888DRAFT_1698412 [Russula emetica]